MITYYTVQSNVSIVRRQNDLRSISSPEMTRHKRFVRHIFILDFNRSEPDAHRAPSRADTREGDTLAAVAKTKTNTNDVFLSRVRGILSSTDYKYFFLHNFYTYYEQRYQFCLLCVSVFLPPPHHKITRQGKNNILLSGKLFVHTIYTIYIFLKLNSVSKTMIYRSYTIPNAYPLNALPKTRFQWKIWWCLALLLFIYIFSPVGLTIVDCPQTRAGPFVSIRVYRNCFVPYICYLFTYRTRIPTKTITTRSFL